MLDTIYTILIAAGIVLPLLSLLFGGVDALLGGVDLDLDGDGNAGFLSFNFNALLFSLVVVGCIGKLCLSSFHLWPVSLVAGLICGAAAYILICKFLILPLKRNNAKAMRAEDALFQHVNVIETIPGGADRRSRQPDYLSRQIPVCRLRTPRPHSGGHRGQSSGHRKQSARCRQIILIHSPTHQPYHIRKGEQYD